MRSLLNILIMAFVVVAIWYQIKTNDFPAVSNYLKSTSSAWTDIKNDIPDSFKNIFAPLQSMTSGAGISSLTNLSNLGDVNLNTLTNLVNPTGATVTAPTPIPSLPSSVQNAITKILPSVLVTTPPASSATTNTTTTPASTQAAGGLTVEGIITQTNIQRKSQGVAELTESAQLDASAQAKANDLLAKQYFAHVAPDGTTVVNLVTDQGYTYIKIGENLALGTFDGDAGVVTAWMNSPEHRANMLDPEFTQMGAGVVYGMYQGRMVSIAVQHFGRPRSACPSVSQSLETQVTDGQTELNTMSASLTTLESQINAGKAEGNDETSDITLYNAGVTKYQSEYASIETLREEYNNEVAAFNSCIGS